MWQIDIDELLEWLKSIGAKLLLLTFITPFMILMTASVYAMVAAQVGTVLGSIAAAGLILGVAWVLHAWLWEVGKAKR
jgi:hypothetical protein